jgi:hypothetical protein
MRVEFNLLSTAKTTPSSTLMPTAEDPNCVNDRKYFDSFNGVFDLKDSALWGKGVDTSIIVTPKVVGKAYLELNIVDTQAFKKILNNFQTDVASEAYGLDCWRVSK